MGLTQQLALVPEGVNIKTSVLTRVASALSKQVMRDFGPIWKIDATVDAFAELEDVPSDYWPIVVVPSVQGAAGYHTDKNGQPYALVEFGPDWSLTASHECLEMLADPFGNRLRAARTLDQAVHLGAPQARVRYLVEVCDPSEASQFAYQVNGVTVSDFYTPDFFDPVAAPGVRYSFTGGIHRPLQILDGGYISWENTRTGDWWQLRMFPDDLSSSVPHLVNLTKDKAFGKLLERMTLREAMDYVTPTPKSNKQLQGPALMAAQVNAESCEAGQQSLAAALRQEMAQWTGKSASKTASSGKPAPKRKRRPSR